MKNIYWLGFLGIASFGAFFANPCFAETSNIIPDNSLGAESSQVIENFQGSPIEAIAGGAQRGINLFHSLREFNVSEGRGAYFLSPNPEIQNILTRITGNNPSEILGTLGTLGNSQVNLFLINPNGIVFGENASLDVGGSFVATTANGIQFGKQGTFSATNPEVPSLLTVNPSAFFFNQINRKAEIRNNSTAPAGIDPAGFQASGLRVGDGKSLLLLGGNITVDGGQLNALGGKVELGGLAETGTVDLDINSNNFELKFPENVTRADVSLSNQARIFVEANGGGDIIFNARNIEMQSGSLLFAGIGQGLGTPETVAGDVTLNATGEIKISDSGSGIRNSIPQRSQGNAGKININTGSFQLLNDAAIASSNFGTGNGADVNIIVKDTFILDNSRISNRVDSITDSVATGNAGNINIDTGFLQMSNDSRLTARNSDIGNPGNININADTVSLDTSNINAGVIFGNAGNVNLKARGSVSLKNESNIFASVQRGDGKAGNILIDAKSLLLNNLSLIGGIQGGGANPTGSAGNITVKTDDFLTLNNSSRISASAFTGSGGDILIDTKEVSLQNGSQITAIVIGDGSAGSLTINASESVEVTGSADSLESGLSISALGDGDAGDLTINTETLIVEDGASISTSAALSPGVAGETSLPLPTGIGKAGNIQINAADSVQIIGTTSDGVILSSLRSNGSSGDGGAININTPRLTVKDGAAISASTNGIGKGGSIEINAPLSVEVNGTSNVSSSNRSSINTENINPLATGDAGSIKINTPNLRVTDNANISASTRGGGKGGNIEINSKSVFLNNDAEITATTFGDKQAGNILLIADVFQANSGSNISTSTSDKGDAGNIIARVKDNITLTGEQTGIFANTIENSTGKGGTIDIDPINIAVKDGAAIAVDSQGFGTGGDIKLVAGFLTLDNGKISADTRSNTGGDITLNLQDLLLLRNGSKISTTAGNEEFGGDGGNININSKFIVALPQENSDIAANAFEGRGGNVNILSQGIFGIQPRQQPNDATSDITASSILGVPGNLNITDPDDSNIRNNLDNLTDNQIDTNALIANSCISRGTKRQLSSFTITGSGGLRNSPGDEFISVYSTGDVRNVESTSQAWKKGDAIIEPTGVYKLSDGRLLLSRECGNK